MTAAASPAPSGAGAETSINPANALVSYRINNDPTRRAYVRHGFGSGNYTGTDNIGQGWPQTSSAWANNWTETGDEGTSGAGAYPGGDQRVALRQHRYRKRDRLDRPAGRQPHRPDLRQPALPSARQWSGGHRSTRPSKSPKTARTGPASPPSRATRLARRMILSRRPTPSISRLTSRPTRPFGSSS